MIAFYPKTKGETHSCPLRKINKLYDAVVAIIAKEKAEITTSCKLLYINLME